MTRNRWIGLALLAAPMLAWLAYGIHLYGWLVPTATYLGIGSIVTGVILLVRSDKRA